eukprot:1185742-Prorocentrum_minimum.AAC.2
MKPCTVKADAPYQRVCTWVEVSSCVRGKHLAGGGAMHKEREKSLLVARTANVSILSRGSVVEVVVQPLQRLCISVSRFRVVRIFIRVHPQEDRSQLRAHRFSTRHIQTKVRRRSALCCRSLAKVLTPSAAPILDVL